MLPWQREKQIKWMHGVSNVTKKIPHEEFFKKGFTTNKHAASDVIQGACGRLYFAECKRSRNIRKPGLPC